jgi:hypothetical protein
MSQSPKPAATAAGRLKLQKMSVFSPEGASKYVGPSSSCGALIVQPRLTGASQAKSSCGSARRDDQMSLPPQPPGRSLPKKISRPSLENVIALSSPTLLSASTLRGEPHAPCNDRRWMTYRSECSTVPTDPGRSEPKKRLSPSGDTLGRCSLAAVFTPAPRLVGAPRVCTRLTGNTGRAR